MYLLILFECTKVVKMIIYKAPVTPHGIRQTMHDTY
jgi:uncharacterized protein YwbE